ncbi:hypothetical protein SAMN02745898_11682 [Streptomyces sp. 136MFCol5.1]|nr:hypothetical protein SAMN02745898_11682 [Streptomyces sp. 136MFCol5.1]SFT30102.1 hypothetical protein SAMN04487982_115113 [Streptomyces sp. ok210]
MADGRNVFGVPADGAGSPCRPDLRRPVTMLKGAAGNAGRLSDGRQDAPWREDVMAGAGYDLWPRVGLDAAPFAISFFHPGTKRDWRAMGAQYWCRTPTGPPTSIVCWAT